MDINVIFNLDQILDDLRHSSLESVKDINNISSINEYVSKLLQVSEWNDIDQINADKILRISNIVYNNTDSQVLLLEDGIYDLLLEGYKRYDPNYSIGAEPIRFANESQFVTEDKEEGKLPFRIIPDYDKMLYYKDINKNIRLGNLKSIVPFYINDLKQKVANSLNIKHNNLELVGTLDKCKFTLNQEAIDKGVFDTPNVKIFERDFIGKHLESGLFNRDDKITMIAELKYDGISVEGIIRDGILVIANSRGDTANDISKDLTPMLGGYRFEKMIAAGIKGTFSCKFEAIIMKPYLNIIHQRFGISYANARNAIIGLSSRLNARLFRDYITLVPLKTDMKDPENSNNHLDRLVEIDFMNKYLTREVPLLYSCLYGNYVSILFQVKKYVEEASYMRSYLPFIYDGVVISYYENEIRNKLGRENFVDKYSMAIKFNPLKRETIFLGYSYTVGQNGIITPMIHYKPVEFYGGIHDKSSGHSYERFMKLGLKLGEIISVEYEHDVMPYVHKLDIEANRNNPNPTIPFIKYCPSCNSPIEISSTGKSARCVNPECPARAISRMTNMMAKLNLKDFGESTIQNIMETLNIKSLSDILNISDTNQVSFLGPTNSQKFLSRVNHLKNDPIYDYDIVGSLGFSNIAKSKWKLILNNISLSDILNQEEYLLKSRLVSIKGIGESVADTIITERIFFYKDINIILMMPNIITTLGNSFGKKIRFTGVRDHQLVSYLNSLGHDAGEGSITKDTNILIVPSIQHISSKTKKATEYGVLIVPIQEFKDNINKYI